MSEAVAERTKIVNPLLYCPPKYLGAKDQCIDPIVALDGLLQDPKIWQLNPELSPDGKTLTVTYRSLLENLYKECVVVLPNGVVAPNTKHYQAFFSMSSTSNGVGQPPTYAFNYWVTDPDGCIKDQGSVPLKGVLSLLYPNVEHFKLNVLRHLEVDTGGKSSTEGKYGYLIKL